MDIGLYTRVLLRFKWITIGGFGLAVVLAFFAMATVSTSGLKYRTPETWEAQSTLLIQQRGFTFGRTVFPATIPPASGSRAETVTPQYGDDGRLSGLALLYARLATSDPVMRHILRAGPLHGNIAAAPIYTSNSSNSGTLPMMQISGFADSPRQAATIAQRGTTAFLSYLEGQQKAAKIPANQRVIVQVVNEPRKPFLLAGRKKTIPVLIFVTMMTLAVGLAFLLENLRPRVRETPQPEMVEPTVMPGFKSDRRSA